MSRRRSDGEHHKSQTSSTKLEMSMVRKTMWLGLAGLLLASPPVIAQPAKPLDGDWDGTLTAPGGIKEHFDLHVESHDGLTEGTLVAIDEGGAKVPMTITHDGNSIVMNRDKVPGFIKGALAPDGTSFQGTLGSTAMPLIFRRRAAGAAPIAAPKRPQEPKPPFPYRTEDVSFSGPGGITLAGTLTVPEGAGPFPAVVLVQGSGPHDRDESMLGHKPFLLLADTLTRRGVAVLRTDKRGIGKSSGDYAGATSTDFADDTEASVAYLRTLQNINSKKIGLIGHSEGGIIAPMVAVKDPSIAFIVLMAGPGIRGTELGLLQARLIGQTTGIAPLELEKQVETFRRMSAIAIASKDTEDAQKNIVASLPSGMNDAQTRAMTDRFASPWGRFMLAYDPAPMLQRVNCPVLAINGSLDLQVPPREDLAAIKTALAANRDATIMNLPGLNHLFQTAKTGALSEYSEIEETISPRALDVISGWIMRHVR